MKWTEVRALDPLRLYAGDIYRHHEGWVGLSTKRDDERHVIHDCTWHMPLPSNSVETYQSEDVFEHIELRQLPAVLEEIYRVLKPGALFRWSMPDYKCDVLRIRSVKDRHDRIVFDPGGGGEFVDGKVVGGGHVWFPDYQSVWTLIHGSPFKHYEFLHYYTPDDQTPIVKEIDFSLGHIQRVPPHDKRVLRPLRPMSIVVDLRK